jgi:crotonobetainyl-CoA:carnitine CoA-transferase CaiB-like acyl-CoA transferase
MTALQGVMTALFARTRTGQGQHVAVSLYGALADWMNVPYLQYAYGGKVPARSGLNHPTIAPYGAYACCDGRAVLVAVQNEREWPVFCREVLERPEVAMDARFDLNTRRVANRLALDEIIRSVFGGIDRDEAVARLERARIAYGRVSTLEDLSTHPQNRYLTVDSPAGPIRMLAPGAVVDGQLPPAGAVPALGQDTARVIEEFTGHRSRP